MAFIKRVILLAIVSKLVSEFFITGNTTFAAYADPTADDSLSKAIPDTTLPGGSGHEVDFTSETLMVPKRPLVKVETTVGPPFEPNPVLVKKLTDSVGPKGNVKLESIKEEDVIRIPGGKSPIESKKKSVVTVSKDMPSTSSGNNKKKKVTFSDETKVIEPLTRGNFTTFGYTPYDDYTPDTKAEKIYRGGMVSVSDDESDDEEDAGPEPIHTPASYDGMHYVKPYDLPKSNESNLEKLRKNARNTLSKAGKTLEKVADRTKVSTMRVVNEFRNKTSKSKAPVEPELSSTTSNPTGLSSRYALSSSQFRGKLRNSSRDILSKQAQILKNIGGMTRQGVYRLNAHLKTNSAVARKSCNSKFNLVKEKIKECGRKGSKPCKLRKDEGTEAPKVKGSMTMYFKDQYGRLLSEDEIKYL
ncbi:hypothetical protein TpMuguga_01g00334 [Theileria parva strain Muguga]|uniref:Uncharacterized protein n=1 Tax=Theileria parva TaxID=5875 RepID=Q4N8Y0_THEPA|nr:uncharacterized protein TpMuguga_01g00334 [Theileria parva strain Muguga]EAN33578.1 hypothetical protein TpMuguga_01g00334 [Theileria parva strain Muguga]|eukprot:XP_765861.1 hypothetical protein [Theileria parva strain Muguga]